MVPVTELNNIIYHSVTDVDSSKGRTYFAAWEDKIIQEIHLLSTNTRREFLGVSVAQKEKPHAQNTCVKIITGTSQLQGLSLRQSKRHLLTLLEIAQRYLESESPLSMIYGHRLISHTKRTSTMGDDAYVHTVIRADVYGLT